MYYKRERVLRLNKGRKSCHKPALSDESPFYKVAAITGEVRLKTVTNSATISLFMAILPCKIRIINTPPTSIYHMGYIRVL